MKLTLRTLLAYMDDILEPADAEEIERKIEETPFARALVHRIRNATRRLRLGAPKLSGKGMGMDPNTVAEYLDYTLAADRVQDFQQVCLESDVHLAEVAACHQILTMVLGGAADVDPALRDRIVALGESASTGPAEKKVVPDGGAAESRHSLELDREPGDGDPTLPGGPALAEDGGRARRRAALAVALGIGLILLLTAILWKHPFGPPAVSRNREGTSRPQRPTRAEEGTSKKPGAQGGAERRKREGSPKVGPDAPADHAADGGNAGRVSAKAAKAGGGAEGAAGHRAGSASKGPAGRGMSGADKEDVGDRKAREAADGRPGGEAPASESAPAKAAPAESAKKDKKKPIRDLAVFQGDASQLAGVFQVGAQRELDRLVTGRPVRAAEEILVPPLFDTSWTDFAERTWRITGPAFVRVLPAAGPDDPWMDVRIGRVRLEADEKAPRTASIAGFGATVRFELAPGPVRIAIEVEPAFEPGADPVTAPRFGILRCWVLQGRVEAESQALGLGRVALEEGQQLLCGRGEPVVTRPEKLPGWTEGELGLRLLEREAAAAITRHIAPDRPMLLSLHELADQHRRVEVRATAIRTMMYAGQFWSFVDALADTRLKAYWRPLVGEARRAIGLSPAHARALRDELVSRRGEAGRRIDRTFWGYTPEQLQAGADDRLLAMLESQAVDERVAAFCTLQSLVGATYRYRPERAPAQQRAALVKWQRMIRQRQWVADPKEQPAPSGNGAGPSDRTSENVSQPPPVRR